MSDFIHIDIAADNPERATRFYHDVFGWKINKLEGPIPYWLISTASTADGPCSVGAGVAKRQAAWQSVTPTIDVPSVDDYAKKIEKHGGTVIMPKNLIPGIGYLLSFKDTEGNIFAILESVEENQFANIGTSH